MASNQILFNVNVELWVDQYRSGLIQRPDATEAVQVGEYSFDYEKGLKAKSKEQLRGYVKPSLGINLYEGVENKIPHKNNNSVHRILLKAGEIGLNLNSMHIVTGRNCLKILTSAISSQRRFKNFAMKRSGEPTVLWKGFSSQKRKDSYSLHAGVMFEISRRGRPQRCQYRKIYSCYTPKARRTTNCLLIQCGLP